MKNLLILVASFLVSNSYGQCTIAGNNTLNPNEIASFTVDAKAQCDECYSWKSSSEPNLTIEGNNKTNKINVKSAQIGKGKISVSVLTSQGLVQCDKIVEVIAPVAIATSNVIEKKQSTVENSCGILIDDFKEVKVSDAVISFFPNVNPTDYLYKWSVSYANGEVQESSEKIPQFFYSDINFITLVKLRITRNNPLCAITISKKFDEGFWKAKKVSKIEQKVYAPVSYSEYAKPHEKSSINNDNTVSKQSLINK